MPAYSIKELRGVPLSGPRDGIMQIDFLVYRDGLLIGPYDSRDEAERAVARLELADKR